MTKVLHCPKYHCEANQNGICAVEEVFLSEDSSGLHCLQFFEAAERAQGYIPSWEVPRHRSLKTLNPSKRDNISF